MIKFIVINSSNINQIGMFEFKKNTVIFSKSNLSDFLLDSKISFALEVKDSDLYLLNPTDEESVLINNKFSGSINKIQVGSTLKSGSLELKIENFKLSEQLSYKEKLNLNTETIIQSDPSALKVINQIRKVISDVN